MKVLNLVELFSDEEEEQSFDQKCKFGNRVGGHAVYCHCENENAPRKCRRSWYTGGEEKDEDCEFFEININYKQKQQ